MVHDRELIVLHGIHNLLYIDRGESLAIVVRQQPCGRLGYYHPVRSACFQSLAVFHDKGGAFFKKQSDCIGFGVDSHHDFRHVEQPAAQGIRPDAA